MNNPQVHQNRGLSEEDETILALVGICVIFSVCMPMALLVSPDILKETPLLISVFAISLLGPGFTITLRDMRFLLSY